MGEDVGDLGANEEDPTGFSDLHEPKTMIGQLPLALCESDYNNGVLFAFL